MLDALWDLARVPALPPKLVHQAMNEHLNILNESASREQVSRLVDEMYTIIQWSHK